MSAEDLLNIIADEDGKVEITEAAFRLSDGVTRLAEQGAVISADRALRIMQLHQDGVNSTLAEVIVKLQAAVVQLQDGVSTLLTGQRTAQAEYDVEAELEALTLGFEVNRLGLLYDALEEGLAPDEPSE